MAYPSSLDLSNANDALARISEAPISSFTENSTKARIIARLYPRVRGLMFAAGDWRFATARAALVPSGASAPFPWAYEYLLPANVARPRMVLAGGLPADGVTLEPVPFEEGVNAAGTAGVIRTDVSPATLVYTMELIDPALWDAGFTSSFTIQLAAEIALGITGNGNVAQAMRQEAAISIQTQMPMGQAQSVTSARRGPSTTTMAREG
jgi:hypothetical protein